jgi:hypothetical protein
VGPLLLDAIQRVALRLAAVLPHDRVHATGTIAIVLGIEQAVELPPLRAAREHPGRYRANAVVDVGQDLQSLIRRKEALASPGPGVVTEAAVASVDLDLHVSRRHPIPESLVDDLLGRPQDARGFAVGLCVLDMSTHQFVQDPLAPVRG